jgi:hypothetical protein
MEVQLHAFLNSALDGGEWSVSCRLTLGDGSIGTPRIGGWVGPRICLNVEVKINHMEFLEKGVRQLIFLGIRLGQGAH